MEMSRKLMEPKSVQTWYDLTKDTSSEERFNNAITLLEQWNKDYIDKEEVIPIYTVGRGPLPVPYEPRYRHPDTFWIRICSFSLYLPYDSNFF